MTVLYVSTDGAQVGKSGGNLVVRHEGRVLEQLPLGHLESAVILPTVQVSTQALTALLSSGVPLSILSHGGDFLGRLCPPWGHHSQARARQYAYLSEGAGRLELARRVVAGKIENQRQVLLRRRHDARDGGGEAGAVARHLGRKGREAFRMGSTGSLMGLEGSCARLYWRCYGAQVPGELGFRGRQYRPSPDPVNAVLSFGYTLLTTVAAGAVEGAGLDPDAGFLHGWSHGRPSLALDLIEPFRAPVVDRLVMRLFNLGMLKAGDFEGDAREGVRMLGSGRRTVYRAWDELRRETGLDGLMLEQAVSLRRFFTGGAGQWSPWAWKARP